MIGSVTLRSPTTMDRFQRKLAAFTLSLLSLMVIAFFVTVIYPWNPITKLDIAIVEAQSAKKGITVIIDYCKVRDWPPSEVRWSLVNDITIVLPTTLMSMPVGCHVKPLSIPMPIHAIPGTYQLQEELIYRVFPWRTYTYIRRTNSFTLGE